MEEFLEKFRTRSHSRMSATEKEQFDKAVGYSEDLSKRELSDLYDKVHIWYDCYIDELEDEDEVIEINPTCNLVLTHMRRDWFHVR